MKTRHLYTLTDKTIYQLIELSIFEDTSKSHIIEKAINYYYIHNMPYQCRNDFDEKRYKELNVIINELREKWSYKK